MSQDSPPGETAVKAAEKPEPRLRKFISQQMEKATSQFWNWLFAVPLAILLSWAWHWGAVHVAALGTPRVPLWLLVVLLFPAGFGIFVFISSWIWRRKMPLYVTLDPLASFCQETHFGQRPALLVYLRATLTNTGDGDGLLMYAYPRGTTSLTHFFEPIALPPRTAIIDVDLQFFCTLPSHHLKDPYSATLIFVDTGGHKHRQRFTLKLQPKAVPAPAKPASPAPEQKPAAESVAGPS